jgi:hypothetical protein
VVPTRFVPKVDDTSAELAVFSALSVEVLIEPPAS